MDAETLPRDSQSHVHLSSAGKVEGVEGHLGGGLADGLSRQQAHGLTRVAQRTLPLVEQQLLQAEHTHTHRYETSCFHHKCT